MKKILVTGGSGFLGHGLVARLANQGNKVVVFDNNFRGSFSKFDKKLKNKIIFIKGDIRNINNIKRAAKGCSIIYHLAFINGTSNFYEKPKLVLDVGIIGTLNILKTCLNIKNIKEFYYASSSEVYHKPKKFPASEKEYLTVPNPQNPRFSYSGAKIIGEIITLNYLKDLKIKHSIFRPHNVFGANMGFEHVIPEIIKKIFLASNKFKKNICKIRIQGNGSETRSFCYVDDAVEQILAIRNKGKNKEIYNIGQSKEIKIESIINDIGKILGIKVKILKSKVLPGSVKRRCPNVKKIKKIYKLKNNYTLGLKRTVKWYKEYFANEK
jgi:nucleoside-diphosphate-sugar epimerase